MVFFVFVSLASRPAAGSDWVGVGGFDQGQGALLVAHPGESGDHIAKSMPFSERATWAWITRTYAYDEFIKQQVREGVDMIVNLAAGLDARPIE